jgi:hypothetical protein
LTGRPPFRPESAWDTVQQVMTEDPVPPSRLQSKMPRDVETICLKCLRKEPGERYTSAQVLAEDLRRFLAGEPILARPVSRLMRLTRWCCRNPALASAGGLALVGVAGVVALAVAFVIHQAQAAHDLRAEQGKTLEALRDAEQRRRQAERLNLDLSLDRGMTLCN